MHRIFHEIADNHTDLKPTYLDLSKEKTIALTYDNNLVYYDENSDSIRCYGLIGKKVVLEKKVKEFSKSSITRIIVSKDYKTYLIGCLDGSVYLIKAFDFEVIDEYKFHSDDKNI